MVVEGATTNNTANPGCRGNVTVPYCFGIGTDCSLDYSFNATCHTSYEPPKLFPASGDVEVYSISDSEVRIATTVSYICYNQRGPVEGVDSGINLSWHKVYTFSIKNKLIVIGCDDYALITGKNNSFA
ncbi:hypothetical protein L1987_33328 [Smallanthus sonchifolius]|uniref:Uncharacterized protein n=1 Tax=Smallanthus sonchifolius TaxID=185202 RepID=A0ACB9HQR0_9ASTR|nr:hypothetical protein L1987_33328 [Smallanthus sonchifolius]